MKTELLQPSLVSGHEMLKIAFCDEGKKILSCKENCKFRGWQL